MSIGNEQHTNDIFKQKFEDFNIEPSPQVWSNIKDSIAREKRNNIIIISTVSIAASLLLLLLPNWLINKSPLDSNNNLSSVIAQEDTKNKSDVNKEESSIIIIKAVSDSLEIAPKPLPKPKKSIQGNNDIKKTTAKTIIISPNKMYLNNLLAINNNINMPSKIEENRDLEKIRRNIELINRSNKSNKIQPKIQFNFGQSKTNNSSNSINPEAITKFALGEFASLQDRSSVVKRSSVKINADFGLNIEIPICKKMSLVSGVKYLSFTNDKGKSESQIATLGPIEKIDEIFQNIGTNKINDINQSFSNLEIPCNLKYYIINRKFSLYLTGGVGINFLINNNAKISLTDGTKIKSKTEDLSKLSYSGLVGLGISYNINKSIYLSIAPHFRHYFNSLSKNKEIIIKPDIFNVSLGLGFKF